MIDFNAIARLHETCMPTIDTSRRSAPAISSRRLSRGTLRMLLVLGALAWALISVLVAAWLVNG